MSKTIADLKIGDNIVVSGERGTVVNYRLSTVGTAKGNALVTIAYDEIRQATIVFKNAKAFTLDAVAKAS